MMRLAIVAALGLLAALLVHASARAHWDGPTDPKIQAWFSAQMNGHGGSCCTDADGRAFYGGYSFDPNGDVEFDADGTHYHLPAYMNADRAESHRVGRVVVYGNLSGRADELLLCSGERGMTKQTRKAKAIRRAQQQAKRKGVGVNDGYGNIWYPPSKADNGVPVCQPDYGHWCEP